MNKIPNNNIDKYLDSIEKKYKHKFLDIILRKKNFDYLNFQDFILSRNINRIKLRERLIDNKNISEKLGIDLSRFKGGCGYLYLYVNYIENKIYIGQNRTNDNFVRAIDIKSHKNSIFQVNNTTIKNYSISLIESDIDLNYLDLLERFFIQLVPSNLSYNKQHVIK